METVSSKQIASVQIPNGTKVIYDGKLYLFHLRYSGIKCFLAEIEKVPNFPIKKNSSNISSFSKKPKHVNKKIFFSLPNKHRKGLHISAK